MVRQAKEKALNGKPFRKRLCLAAAIAVSLVCMRTYALLEVSGDYTINGTISSPVRFTGDANLTIAANVATTLGVVTNDGHNVTINLENGCACTVTRFESLNGATMKINFKGGRFKDAGKWGSYWFKTPAGCTVELAAVDGNNIWFTHPNSSYKYFNDGDGRVFTSGAGKFLVQTEHIINGQILDFRANIPSTNYCHTGGTAFYGQSDSNGGWITFTGDNQFPPGRVELGRTSKKGGAWVNLGGKSHTAEQVVRIGSYGCITNRVSTAGTLVFSKADSLLDCPVQGNVVVQKKGAATSLTVKSGPISTLESREGTVLVKPDMADSTVKVGKLRVDGVATLTVDACTLEVDAADIGLGATVACVNGGKLRILTAENATNVMDATSWGGTALEKTGAGVMGLGSESAAALSGVNVIEGTLKLGRIGVTNRFWRVSIKDTTGGSKLALGPFRLYDLSRSFADGGSPAGTSTGDPYVDKSSDGITASQLAANEFICSRTDYHTPGGQVGSDYTRTPKAMFGAAKMYSCLFDQAPYPSVGDPASWVVMTYRIPDSQTPCGYDVRAQWSGTEKHPGTWSIESSPNGTDGSWELVDEKSGMVARAGQCWYHGDVVGNDNPNPYTFQSLRRGGAGISPSANVQVAAGATLDATLVDGGQAVSSLTVDCTAGGGTLKGVKFASGGTLNLVNFPAGTKLRGGYVVPLTFEVPGDTSNVRTWSVKVDGVANRAKLACQDGGLIVAGPGTMVVFR